MKEKWEKVKEVAGVVYMIVALYVGIYYTYKWLFGGLFVVCNWICDKIKDRKEKNSHEELDDSNEMKKEYDQSMKDYNKRHEQFQKDYNKTKEEIEKAREEMAARHSNLGSTTE